MVDDESPKFEDNPARWLINSTGRRQNNRAAMLGIVVVILIILMLIGVKIGDTLIRWTMGIVAVGWMVIAFIRWRRRR